MSKPKPFRLKAPIASEHQEQASVIAWWAMYSSVLKIDHRLLFAIPNGAVLAGDIKARCMQMNKLKAEGLRPGVPDLFLAMPKMIRGIQPQAMLFAGLFIELKRKDGKPSPAQLEMFDILGRQGYVVAIALGADEAIAAIKGYLKGYPVSRETAATIAALPTRLTGPVAPDEAIEAFR